MPEESSVIRAVNVIDCAELDVSTDAGVNAKDASWGGVVSTLVKFVLGPEITLGPYAGAGGTITLGTASSVTGAMNMGWYGADGGTTDRVVSGANASGTNALDGVASIQSASTERTAGARPGLTSRGSAGRDAIAACV